MKQQKKGRSILVVDDNEDIRKQLKWGLGRLGYELIMAADADEAIALFRKHRPRVVTLDLGLPPHENDSSEGFRCLSEMLAAAPDTKVVVITGNEERENAIQAINSGAYDFYAKPINLDELRIIIDRALHLQSIEEDNRRLSAETGPAGDQFGIVGECPQIQDVLALIRKVATTDVPVLVLGESGTGKELIAQAIHSRSMRAGEPVVAVNCGAIPENLLEAEFFGHEKGAYTGADARRKGKVEYADGGTLFLDEIGELPAALQVKLLRFLQDKTFQRIGGRENISVDLRVVSATNSDIKQAMERGEFREDLFYRISVVVIEVPPLRERGGDAVLLANYFLRQAAKESGGAPKPLGPDAVAAIRQYPWPGNVRELENKVRRATIMSSGRTITAEDLGLDAGEMAGAGSPGEVPLEKTLREAREWVERELVSAALKKHEGNVSQASRALGVSRPTLYDLMRKYDLES